jgi:hypothetical protein
MKHIRDALEYARRNYTGPVDEPVEVCRFTRYAPSFAAGELQNEMLARFQEHMAGCEECAGLVDALYAQKDATPAWVKAGEKVRRAVSLLVTPMGMSGRPVAAMAATRSGAAGGREGEGDFFTSDVALKDGGGLRIVAVRHRSGRQTVTVSPHDLPSGPHTYSLRVGGRLVKLFTSDEGMAFEMPRSSFELVFDDTSVIPFELLADEDRDHV